MIRIRSPKVIFLVCAVILLAAAPFAYYRYSPSARKARQMERAARYFSEGDLDKARIEYLNVLRAEPSNQIANRQLGIIWFEEGSLLRALPLLLPASAAEPANFDLHRRLALSQFAAGNPAEAQKEAMTALQTEPAHPEMLPMLVDLAVRKGDAKLAEDFLAKSPNTSLGFHLAQFRLALGRRDFEAATASAGRALQADPNSYAAHVAMGEMYRLKQDRSKAEAEFEKAAALAPLRSTTRLKHAEFKAQLRAFPEALALIQEVSTKAPDYLPAWNLQAQISLAQKNYDEALQRLGNVFVRDPGNFDGQVLAAQIFLTNGDIVKAIATLERLSGAHPTMPAAKVLLGRAYLRVGKLPQAVSALSQAVDADPDNVDAILQLADVNLRQGDTQRVLDTTMRVLKKVPNHPQAEMLLAEAYRQLGKLEDAAGVYRTQMQSAPKNPNGYLMLGMLLLQQKKPAEARQTLEQAASLDPKNPIIAYCLVDLDLNEKNYAAAQARAEQLRQYLPNSAAPDFLAGRVAFAQKDWSRAETLLSKALEIDPGSTSAYSLLLSVYRENHQAPKVIAQREARFLSNPNDILNQLYLAGLYADAGDHPKARDMYEKVLSRQPEMPIALNNLAVLYSEQFNQLDKAQELANRARSRQPESPDIADTLGWILYRQGNFQDALGLLKEAVEKSVGKPVEAYGFHYHLGMAQYMIGNREAALEHLKTAASAVEAFKGKDEIPLRVRLLEAEAGSASQLSKAEVEGMIAKLPDDLWVRLRLGEAFERDGEAAKAVSTFQEASKLSPTALRPTVKLAQLFVGSSNDLPKAMELAKKARALAPSNAELAVTLGRIAFKAGDWPWAYATLQSAGEKKDDDADACYAFAWSGYSLGKVDEAREYMERVSKLGGNSPHLEDARSFLSLTVSDPNALAAAEPEIEKRLAASAKDVPALVAKGALQIRRGDSKGALATYHSVLSIHPEFAPAKVELAALLLEHPDQHQRAYDLATQAYKNLPGDPSAARVLADISFARADFSYALQLWQQSAKKQPLDSRRTYFCGLAHLSLKDKVKAIQAIELALAGNLEEPLRTEAKGKLAELKK
jgi:tetratricopeptide (TPR) repeat protein